MRTYRHWNRVFERSHALDLLRVPREEQRYLIDSRLYRRCLVLTFNQLTKSDNGVTLIEKEWTRRYTRRELARIFGMNLRNLRHVFVFMGNIEFRFTEEL